MSLASLIQVYNQHKENKRRQEQTRAGNEWLSNYASAETPDDRELRIAQLPNVVQDPALALQFEQRAFTRDALRDRNRKSADDVTLQRFMTDAADLYRPNRDGSIPSGGELRKDFLDFAQDQKVRPDLANRAFKELGDFLRPGTNIEKFGDTPYVVDEDAGVVRPAQGFEPKKPKFDAFVDKIDMGNKVRAWKPDGTYEDFPKEVSPSTVMMTDTRRASDEMGIRKEFQSLPEVKAHVEISSQLQRLEKAMTENTKGGSKVAVDQALITILNKMLDPSSVVRESEYARTPGDIAFLNRMRGKIEKLKTGGAGLTDEDRVAIADMARNFASVSQSMYDEQANYYGGLAERYGYNPENVVRLGKFDKKGGGGKDPLGIR